MSSSDHPSDEPLRFPTTTRCGSCHEEIDRSNTQVCSCGITWIPGRIIVRDAHIEVRDERFWNVAKPIYD